MTRFVNAKVWKRDRTGEITWFEVERGKVTNWGHGPEPARPDQVVDLGGRVVVPGFVDAHIHLWKVGDLLDFTLDLRGAKSIGEIQERLAGFAAANPDLPVVKARGFNEADLTERRLLDRRDLDDAVPGRPVYLLRTCAHIAVVNSAALAKLGLEGGAPAPPGGEVRLDAGGRPTGVFTETALGLVAPLVSGISQADYRQMIRSAGREMLRHGVVAVTDPAVHPELMEAYRALDQAGELPIRVNAVAIGIPDGAAIPLPLPVPFRSADLVVDSVKFFADGGLSGATAALSRPYLGGSSRGVLRLSQAQFAEAAEAVHRAGLRVATHAIGDEAIDLVLECYRRLAREFPGGPRHRIEHLGLPTDRHLGLLRDYAVDVATQPIFLEELGRNFQAVLDPGYLAGCYPVRSLLDRGIRTAFSSDAPVVRNLAPLRCIAAAVTRRTDRGELIAPQEAVSVAEGLIAHTETAAAVSGWEGRLGRLEPGYDADFVVLSADPLASAPGALADIEVLATYRAGRPVYRREVTA